MNRLTLIRLLSLLVLLTVVISACGGQPTPAPAPTKAPAPPPGRDQGS